VSQEQPQQQSPTVQRADTIEELSVPFDLAHQRAQELERHPSGQEAVPDEDSARPPRVRCLLPCFIVRARQYGIRLVEILKCALQVVRRPSKGKDPESPTATRSPSSAGSSDKVRAHRFKCSYVQGMCRAYMCQRGAWS